MVTKTGPDNQRVAILVAKFIRGKLKGGEEKELDDWIVEEDGNMKLFEKLISTGEAEWSEKWFAERGVKIRFLKKKLGEFYKPDPRPMDLRKFYLGIAAGVLLMMFVYFVLHYL